MGRPGKEDFGNTALEIGKTALRNYPETAPFVRGGEKLYGVLKWGYRNAAPIAAGTIAGAITAKVASMGPGQRVIGAVNDYISPAVESYHSGVVPQYAQFITDYLAQAAVSELALTAYASIAAAALAYKLVKRRRSKRRNKSQAN